MRTFPHTIVKEKNIIIAILVVMMFYIFTKFFEVGIVSGQSMEPTLKDKQFMLVSKADVSYEKEEIIIFETDDYGVCVKRIEGTVGDTIKLEKGKVYRNNIELSMYTCDENKDYEVTLNENEIFVMGDNANDSIDSRDYGPIDINAVIGVVKYY